MTTPPLRLDVGLAGDPSVPFLGLELARSHVERCNNLPNSPAGKRSNNQSRESHSAKAPGYETRWKAQLEKAHIDRDELLFMLAPCWADDVRTTDRAQYHRGSWHYINFPFKPSNHPKTVHTKPPEAENILTALTENERIAKTENNGAKAIALTWLFHLIGNVHQPLHTAQLFTTAYPNGDRGGNEVCIRTMPKSQGDEPA